MFAIPPPWAKCFRSDDLDEVRAYIAPYDGDHRRHSVGRGGLGYVAHAVKCGNIDLGWTRLDQRQRVVGVPRAVLLHVPINGRVVYQFGTRTLETHPAAAILLPPGNTFQSIVGRSDSIAIRIPSDELAKELRGRRGDGAKSIAWDPTVVPLTAQVVRALHDLHQAFVQASGNVSEGVRKAERTCQRRCAQLESAIVAWVAGQLLRGARERAPGGIGAQRLRRVEEWIDENLTNPITLARLCDIACVGDRWLESSFKSRHGQTPMQYLRTKRLALVRQRLAEAAPGATVARVAGDAGFAHLGRFAAQYRLAFGEMPSETLAHHD